MEPTLENFKGTTLMEEDYIEPLTVNSTLESGKMEKSMVLELNSTEIIACMKANGSKTMKAEMENIHLKVEPTTKGNGNK